MYMKKLVVNWLVVGVIDLFLFLMDNLCNVVKVLGKLLDKLCMVMLDKLCLSVVIEEVIQLGVKVFVLLDGDVVVSVLICWQDNFYDVMYIIGGVLEGVIFVCVVKVLGGDMQVELIDFCQVKGDYMENWQIVEQERKCCKVMGVDVNCVYLFDELVRGNDIFFSVMGVMGGELVNGI